MSLFEHMIQSPGMEGLNIGEYKCIGTLMIDFVVFALIM